MYRIARRGSTVLPHAAGGRGLVVALAAVLAVLAPAQGSARDTVPDGYLSHDSHIHSTDYVQQGTDIRDYLEIMGDKIGRSTLFGIPLQQTWSFENSGDCPPIYYLQTDAPLGRVVHTVQGQASASAVSAAPSDQATQLRVYHQWDPIWKLLTPEASQKSVPATMNASSTRPAPGCGPGKQRTCSDP